MWRDMACDDSSAACTFSLAMPKSCAGVLLRRERRAITCPEADIISSQFSPRVFHASMAVTGSDVFKATFRIRDRVGQFPGN